MSKSLISLLFSVLLSKYAIAAPASSLAASSTVASVVSEASTATAAAPISTVPYASDNANGIMWSPTTDGSPQPIRGSLGATILGPQNVPLDQQNPDLLAPPTTDAGTVGNAKWPMSLSHNRMQTGGWARQQNDAVMPMATGMAGVNMRLEAGAIRELHWHKTAEWAYILDGYTQVSSVDTDGKNYLATVGPGDLWYFPPGVPHSLQATNQSANGTEFLLVFPDGDFSEDSTFLLTDWLTHVPKEVLAKNFQTNMSTFDEIPGQELYIFPGVAPDPDAQAVADPAGQVPSPFTFAFSQVPVTPLAGGSVKIADSRTFNISTQVAVSQVSVDPGAMRELHWHPTQDEWGYILEGQARITLFADSGNARTFNYQPGDVSYIPASYGHYVENIGNTTLVFLEIYNAPIIQDISLTQWLALTPPAMVQATLNLPQSIVDNLNKTKATVVAPMTVVN
ncbi:hypothetical protein EW026_g7578 [Hermanssonia centrifuga]|uniref:Cupin type-1 domain-containing protein n=1 Tax=Hermanssonia centrifuga TaxID=98765 RepID=A0A4S4K7C5_9APHY|nr:hypothetical protein EW026_g7578 [Hermanssonia centrifuga]